MLEIALPHLLRAHAIMFATTQTGHARWVAGFILSRRLERITSRDVTRAYGALRPPEMHRELADVMANLVTIGWLEPEEPDNPAKPVNAWLVNPAVHSRFEARAVAEWERREVSKREIAVAVEHLKQLRRAA